jgi:TonB family protein
MSRLIRSFSFSVIAFAAFSLTALAQPNLSAKATGSQPTPAAPVEDTDRVRDGLVGPVRRVRTEVAKLTNETGKMVESKHALLEVVSYDVKGNKLENQYFPIAGASLTGKEVYKYDEKGNISEMTLLNSDGSLLSKEIYKYEFDFAGNWNKMTTSVAVIDGGKLSFEPSEVTYRSIMYYLDDNILKMAQPATQPVTAAVTPQPVPASNNANNNQTNPAANNTASNGSANNASQPKTVNQPKSGNNSNTVQKNNVVLPHTSGSAVEKITGPVEVASNRSVAGSTAPVVALESDPPPPAPRPLLKPISGGVLNGTALSLPSPSYPEAARRMRIAGVVTIDVIVDETGKVISAVASAGPGLLRDVAVQAALRARFSPTKLSGQPVKVSGTINYKFALAQ